MSSVYLTKGGGKLEFLMILNGAKYEQCELRIYTFTFAVYVCVVLT